MPKIESKNINFKIDSGASFQITDQGFLKVDAFVTRAGIFDYGDGSGGLLRELRPEEEVFSKDSLETLKNIPLTFIHPGEKVNSDNFRQYTVGVVGENIERIDNEKGSFVKANVVVMDSDIVTLVKKNKEDGKGTELSCGYDTSMIFEKGTHEKEGRYDARQTEIKYNHVSIVEKGRAGEEVKLRLDAKDKYKKEDKINKEDLKKMSKFIKNAIKKDGFNMDEMNVEVPEEAMAPLTALSNKVDEAVEGMEKLSKGNEKLIQDKKDSDEKNDELLKETEKLKKDNEELSNLDSPRIQAMIADRQIMEEVAESLEVEHTDSKGVHKDRKVLRDEIVAVFASDSESLKGKEDPYLDARYDTVKDSFLKTKEDKSSESLASFNQGAKAASKAGTKVDDKKDPRDQFNEDTKEIHKVKEDK